MGTRADFYIGRGQGAEWIGSIAWDGYPDGIAKAVLTTTTPDTFRAAVAQFIMREDGTTPEMGWPWPWNDSQTTDYAYALDAGKVWGSCFGRAWFDPLNVPAEDSVCEGEKTAVFPDMTARKKVAFGERSGAIILTKRVAGGGE